MSNFSIGLDYAWQTTATEAAHRRHEFIEPEHLFIGVCKLGNLPSLGNWSDAGIPRAAAAALKAEAEAVAATFQKTGHDRVTLYRDVRKRLGEGIFTATNRTKISRSAGSRLVFERASELSSDSPPVTSLHLLLAPLEAPGTRITPVLADKPPGAPAVYNKIAPPDLTAKAPDESWTQPLSLLLRSARLMRESLTDPYFPRRLSGLSFKEPEFQAAMDIFGDAILKDADPRRAKTELDELARIEDGDDKPKEKCAAVWTIIAGETKS